MSDQEEKTMSQIEVCALCEEPTGKAGRGEDSLYAAACTPAEVGPLCSTCYEALTNEREIETLRMQMEGALELLRDIGDLAHTHSTGPACPDVLWDVREMAYSALRS